MATPKDSKRQAVSAVKAAKVSRNTKSTRSQKKKDKYKQPMVIKKSNRIIEARYYLSLWEMRIFQEMIERVQPNAESFEPAVIPIKQFSKKFGVTGGKAYELVRLAAIDLARRVVHLVEEGEHGRRLVMRPLAVRVDIPADAFPQGDANSYVVLKFNDELKPELLQLSKHYTQYIGEWTTLLKTSYAIRIYEIMCMIRFRREREYTLTEFREMIGALSYKDSGMKYKDKDVAKTYAELNRSILRPSHAQIVEKTDILFDYEPVYDSSGPHLNKPGISGIRFFNIRLKTEGSGIVLPPSNEEVTETEETNLTLEDIMFGGGRSAAEPALIEGTEAEIRPTNLFGEYQPEGKKKPGRKAKVKSDDEEVNQLGERAIKLGVTRTYMNIALETHPLERIRVALEILAGKSSQTGKEKIGNPTGYFYKLVNTEGLEDQYGDLLKAQEVAQENIEEQKRKAQEVAELKKELKRREAERDQANWDINQDQINALTEIFSNDPGFHRTIYDTVTALPFLQKVIPPLLQKCKSEYLYATQLSTYFFNEAYKQRPLDPVFTPVLLSMEQMNIIEQRIQEINRLLSR